MTNTNPWRGFTSPHSTRRVSAVATFCGLLVICGCSSSSTNNASTGGNPSQSGVSGGGSKAFGGAATGGGGRSASFANAGNAALGGSGNGAGAPTSSVLTAAGSSPRVDSGSAGVAGITATGVTATGGEALANVAGAAGTGVLNAGGAAGAPTTTKLLCQPVDDLRCGENNVRERCDASGDWVVAAQQCSGATPACTGNGLCAAFRLLRGNLETIGVAAATPGASYILQHQTLLEYTKACNASYCVTGGIAP